MKRKRKRSPRKPMTEEQRLRHNARRRRWLRTMEPAKRKIWLRKHAEKSRARYEKRVGRLLSTEERRAIQRASAMLRTPEARRASAQKGLETKRLQRIASGLPEPAPTKQALRQRRLRERKRLARLAQEAVERGDRVSDSKAETTLGEETQVRIEPMADDAHQDRQREPQEDAAE